MKKYLDLIDVRKYLKSPIVLLALFVLVVVVFDIIFLSARTKKIQEEANAAVLQWKDYYEAQAQVPAADAAVVQPQTQVSEEAQYMAKVVAGCSTYYSEKVQRAVAWCVLNRVDSALYPETIIEVCEQANQWQGYDNADVIDSIYTLCQDVIDTWRAGGVREVPQDCLYFKMLEDGIELRTDFTGGNTWVIKNS